MDITFEAGVASVCITPPVGVDLTGFGGRPSGCTGIHDDLYAKALVLTDGSQKVALVTSDLLSLDFDIVADLRERVAQKLDIPAGHILLSSSHTHSGPTTITLRGMGDRDEAYIAVLKRHIVGAIVMADAARQPVRVGYGKGHVQVGINRREWTEKQGTILGRNPAGPVLPEVDVLRFDSADGSPFAVFFSHAAHPVVLGRNNLLISADYPGYTMRFVERNEPVAALFAEGCCGNINADRVGGTFEVARRLGTMLGAEVVRTLEAITTTGDVHLSVATEVVHLPLIDPPPMEEAKRTFDEHQAKVKKLVQEGTDEHSLMVPKAYMAWASDMLDLARRGVKGQTQPFEIQAIALGDVAIVALPGEVFVQYALNIRERSPFPHTLVLGYSNGCIGYVPTAADYPYGGYEVDTAYQLYGTQMIGPESEEIILEGAMRVLNRVKV